MIFEALTAASDSRNLEAMISLYHPDYTFVRHQHNVSLSLEEWRPIVEQMLQSDKLEMHDSRCLYENDEILGTCCLSHPRAQQSHGAEAAT